MHCTDTRLGAWVRRAQQFLRWGGGERAEKEQGETNAGGLM